MEQTEYRTITTCVRAPRAAVAYPTWPDWVHNARRTMRSLSRVWGGFGDVLLPLGADNQVPGALLSLLRTFDPDDVMLHELTIADMTIGSPEQVSKLTERHKLNTETAEETWARIASNPVDYHLDTRTALAAQVDAWCSPLRMTVRDDGTFRAQNVYTFRQTDSTGGPGGHLSLLPSNPSQTVYDLDLSGVDPFIALMAETRVGALADADREDLHVIELPVLEEDLPGIIAMAITGTAHWNWDLHARFQSATGVAATAPPPSALPAEQYLANTPLGRTRIGLAKVGTYPFAQNVCVIGDTAQDHALAVLCDKLFSHGAWIPRRLLADDSPYRKSVCLALYLLLTKFHSGDSVRITSASLSKEELVALISAISDYVPLKGSWSPGEQKVEVVSVGQLCAAEGWSWLADKRWFSARRTVPCRQSSGELSLLVPIEPIVPVATDELGEELRWCVDVMVPGYRAAPRTAIGTDMVTQPTGSFREAVARVTQFGVSFASTNMGLVLAGSPLESRIAQPLLQLPSAEQIFSSLAAKHGAVCQRSAHGRRAVNATELWGSFPAITADLQGPIRQLLDAFLPPANAGNGDYGKGYAIRKYGYLNLQHATTALGTAEPDARQVLDRLLAHRVLRRGLVLNCGRCAAHAFYRVSAIADDGFACAMCGSPNQLIQDRWYKAAAEPVWHYALDQVVRDLLAQHGDIPLLAAAKLSSGNHTMLWAPELQITFDDGDEAELDLALIIDGRVVIGEAKSNNKLKTADKGTQEAAKRLVRAAQLLSADEIVLATSQASWAAGVKDAVVAAIGVNWDSGPIPQVRELVSIGAGTS